MGLPSTLSYGIALDMATAAVYLAVAYLVLPLSLPNTNMGEGFRWSLLFWTGTAAFLMMDGGYTALVLGRDVDNITMLGILVLRRSVFILGILGLVRWLQAILWAKPDTRLWMTVLYGLIILCSAVAAVIQQPIGHEVRTYDVEFIYAHPTPLWFNALLGLGIFLPPFLSGFVLLRRFPRQPAGSNRYQVTLLSTGLIVFTLVVTLGFFDDEWNQYGIFEDRAALGVALGTFLALRPLPLLRKLLGVKPVRDPEEFAGRHQEAR